jgi:hypothetical protein
LAQAFFHGGEDFGVLPGLAIDDSVGMKSDPGEGGRKKIAAMQAPEDRACEAGEDSCGEQRCHRGVASAWTALTNLMHRAYCKATTRQNGIHLGDAER